VAFDSSDIEKDRERDRDRDRDRDGSPSRRSNASNSTSRSHSRSPSRGPGLVYVGEVGEPFLVVMSKNGQMPSHPPSPVSSPVSPGPSPSRMRAYTHSRRNSDWGSMHTPELESPYTSSNRSRWVEPDSIYIAEARNHITAENKRVFWEMVKVLVEAPQIAERCRFGNKSPKDLAAMLRRPEFCVLWAPEALDCLPRAFAADLMTGDTPSVVQETDLPYFHSPRHRP
jgi:hypothetical protein